MSVRNTKGLKVFLSKLTTTAAVHTPTAISKADTAVATFAAVTGIATGDFAEVTDTEFPELDGKFFAVGAIDGGAFTIELLGANTTKSTATFDSDATSAPEIKIYPATDFESVCLSAIGINSEAASTVPVPTFCDPSASVPGSTAGAGTLDFSGYMDTAAKGFMLLDDAFAAGNEQIIKIEFPGTGGYFVGKGTLSSFSFSDIPLDGAISYSAQYSLSSNMKHAYKR